MQRQATQPAALPTGRKRRRASSKKKESESLDEQKAKELDTKATDPPNSELLTALFALPQADETPPPPPPSPLPQTLNELMDHTLPDYQEARMCGQRYVAT